jgi:Calpain family cysteine protease
MARRTFNRLKKLALGVEKLEERTVMAASLTASLTSGVLRIEGTKNNDNIVLNTANGNISVAGLRGSWNVNTVQSIVIDTLAGNDTVRLPNLNAGGTFSKPIEIRNSAGIDKVFGLNGAGTNLNVGSLKLNNSGGTGGSGGTTSNTWFDSNIADAALKSYLKTSFADNKLDRREIIETLKLVSNDNTVSSTEYADLSKVAGNSSLFTSVEYVGVLLKNVVLGNAANAKYQGTTLGNLTANANADKLNKLVNKWFLGLDRPQATAGSTTLTYVNAAGSLFSANGPQFTDVKQGALGDCYFLGAIGEVALKSAQEIRNMFIVNGDGTYTVRFFNAGKAEYVTVDSQLPTYSGRFAFANYGGSATNSSNVLWVALAEKAYAQINECGWIRSTNMGGGINSYQALAGGWFSAAVSHIANKVSTTTMFGSSAGNDFGTFQTAFNSGKMVGFASKSTPASGLIVGGHQYVAVSLDATAQTVTLFNPWGINNGSRFAGLVTMKWSELAGSFSYWDRTR